MGCPQEEEDDDEEKNVQRLSGAWNNDGHNVTSNKFNEITDNFPNGRKIKTLQIM